MKKEFENITLLELMQVTDKETIDEYFFAFKFGKQFKERVDHVGIGAIESKPFIWIKELQRIYTKEVSTEQLVEQICLFSAKQPEEILSLGLLEFMQTRNYLEKAIDEISEIENIKLGRGTTTKEERAGIDNLGIYGYEWQLMQLCKDELWRREQMCATPYWQCFLWLAMWADRTDFSEAMQQRK